MAGFFFVGCSKEEQSEQFCFNGVVKWTGDPAADGLGWVIYPGDSATDRPYIPVDLSSDYKADNLKIAACLEETSEKFYCQCAQPLTKYRVVSIGRR